MPVGAAFFGLAGDVALRLLDSALSIRVRTFPVGEAAIGAAEPPEDEANDIPGDSPTGIAVKVKPEASDPAASIAP